MKRRHRRRRLIDLRMFDLANDDNSQKDSLELYWDALEATDAGDGDKIRKENNHHPEYYLLANLVEAIYSVNERLNEIRDLLERGS